MLTSLRRFAVPFLGLALASVLFMTSTSVANQVGFSSSLPRWQEHTDVVGGHKDSYWSSNAFVRINSGNDNRNGWYWVDRIGKGQVTRHRFVASGKGHTLPYYNGGSWTGDTMLRGHQEWWGPGEDRISGLVDFG